MIGRFPTSVAQGGEDNSLNVNDWLRIETVFSRYGYGYPRKHSDTAQFSIIVLLLHMALAITHLLFILYKTYIVGDGMVSSWTTIAELTTLALNSKPSERLTNTSAGVNAAGTWRQPVAIREGKLGQLEIVVGADNQARYPAPIAGKEYGSGPGCWSTAQPTGSDFFATSLGLDLTR